MKISKAMIVSLGLFVAVLTGAFFVFTSTGIGKVEAQTDSATEGTFIELEATGGTVDVPKSECMTESKRVEIQRELNKSIEKLRAQGKLPPVDSAVPAAASFTWPVRGYNGAALDPGVHGISNFVDQNPSFPNQILDYNCGSRTYDSSNGYNHAGIDIFTWPFWWNKMDNNEVAVVAADAGTIIFKSDGNADRSCSLNNNNWNAVYLRHSDGTVSWYGHLKRLSPTIKAVGDTVTKGEYLGIVGSSGNSTGPHLHFEVYNASGALQDTNIGACNTMSSTVYWEVQKPYRDSKVNKLMTHSSPPSFQSCPNPDIINAKSTFNFGEQIYLASYYRDQLLGHQSVMSIIRPNGTTYSTWNFTSPNTYTNSYWFWNQSIPNTQPAGTWKFRVTYQSETHETSFTIQSPRRPPFDYDGDGKADVSVYRPGGAAIWYVQNSSNGANSINQFGGSGDASVPADYDGDGKADVAIYRPSNGIWYWIKSSNGEVGGNQFGGAGDLPVPADYDGDGKADIAIFRPATGAWWVLNSSTNSPTANVFGLSGDQPTLGDFDGDGKADLAVFRPSNAVFYRSNSSNGAFGAVQFGVATDKAVPADYDGDGKTDVAIFRPSNGTWYYINSASGSVGGYAFGTSGDLPVPADYDGDGKADIAVFRPSLGMWYLLRTTAGLGGQQFGASGDMPTPNSFIR